MLNKNFKKVFLTVFTIGLSPIAFPAEILQGLALEHPIIRISVETYFGSRNVEPKKLVLGAGDMIFAHARGYCFVEARK